MLFIAAEQRAAWLCEMRGRRIFVGYVIKCNPTLKPLDNNVTPLQFLLHEIVVMEEYYRICIRFTRGVIILFSIPIRIQCSQIMVNIYPVLPLLSAPPTVQLFYSQSLHSKNRYALANPFYHPSRCSRCLGIHSSSKSSSSENHLTQQFQSSAEPAFIAIPIGN